jgi:hypothetical protein
MRKLGIKIQESRSDVRLKRSEAISLYLAMEVPNLHSEMKTQSQGLRNGGLRARGEQAAEALTAVSRAGAF